MARKDVTTIHLDTGAQLTFDGVVESVTQTQDGIFTTLRWTNPGKGKRNLWGLKLQHVVAVVSTSMPEGTK